MKRITTLIPANKSDYLAALFASLQAQTFKDFAVLVSDDSPGGRITGLLQTEDFRPLLDGLDVRVIQGPRRGAYRNVQNLLREWNGATDLFHLLCDDDVVYPKFYEYHALMQQTPNVAVTISKRWTAQADGLPVEAPPMPPEIERNPSRAVLIDSNLLFKTTVPFLVNWLGEFSNAVINKNLALTRTIDAIPFMGIEDLGIGDISFFLQASLAHKIVFIHEYLGVFRMNPQQHTAQLRSHGMKEQFLGWAALAIASMRLGKLSRHEAFQTSKGSNSVCTDTIRMARRT
jgi:Glycosyl transferase family 2